MQKTFGQIRGLKMIATRQKTITQVLIWKLVLNPMTARTEAAELVAWSDDKDKLIEWYRSQMVEPYVETNLSSLGFHGKDYKWHKTFAKNSKLEWYNPTFDDGSISSYGHGLHSEWIDEDALWRINYYRV